MAGNNVCDLPHSAMPLQYVQCVTLTGMN